MLVFMPSILDTTAYYLKDSHSQFIIGYKKTSFGSMPFWIADEIQHGLEIDFHNFFPIF